MDPTSDQPNVGYKTPPIKTRFKNGASGNPRGRPQVSRRALPYDTVLGQMVTVRENGRERQVTAAEAFLLHVTNRGLAGDGPTGRAALAAIESARAARVIDEESTINVIIWKPVAVGSLTCALEALGMGRCLDPYRPTARVVLEPWVVEAALARLGAQQLDQDEQRIVAAATRTPKRVHWPEWWTEF